MFALALLFVDFSSSLKGLFDWGEVNTFIFWKTDPWVLSSTDDEDVTDSGSEAGTSGVSDVDDIETTKMSLSGGNDTYSSDIVTVCDDSSVSRFEFGVFLDG